jgi:hypothetical protein
MVVSAIFWLSGLIRIYGALAFEDAIIFLIEALLVGGAVVMSVFGMCLLLRIL